MADKAELYRVKVTGGLLFFVALDFADAYGMTRALVKGDEEKIDAIELIESDAVFVSSEYLKWEHDKPTER